MSIPVVPLVSIQKSPISTYLIFTGSDFTFQFKQKPTIPETYRAAPLNLGPECIHHKKHLISKLYMSNQLSKITEERQEDARNINQNVKSLPVKIRYVEIGLFCISINIFHLH
jgi:hypothetical protein